MSISQSPSTELAIETRNLRKSFGGRVAVGGLTLNVNRGEIFGFLGPNGAGKSTSIKMLLGLVHPSGGEAFVLGEPIGSVKVRRQIGFLPEDFRFYDWLTATELLELHGRLAEMTSSDARSAAPTLLETVGLSAHAHRRLRGFSKGMLQRLGLAQAMIHQPRIVFLDEPTSGLDPMGRRMVRDVIRGLRDRGTTVFLNSHLLSEIEVTCNRVAFIKEGQVVESRELAAYASNGSRRVTMRVDNVPPGAAAQLARWVTNVVRQPAGFTFDAIDDTAIADVVRHLVTAGGRVYQVSQQATSLEDDFVRIVGEDSGA